MDYLTFQLSDEFVKQYENEKVNWGFNGLGYVVYKRTYARKDNPRLNGEQEEWTDTVRRVIEGTFTIQKNWLEKIGRHPKQEQLNKTAEKAFDLMFNFKWTPPGRGIANMGSAWVHERGVYECLNNCGFVSTEDIDKYLGYIWEWFVNQSMLGVGVGFDTRGAGKLKIIAPRNEKITYKIPDTREGWAKSVALLFDSYVKYGFGEVEFDYSLIRPKGAWISGPGAYASGPEPLKKLHDQMRSSLGNYVGEYIDSRLICDIANQIGVCVVSGGVRRTAEIAFGDPDDWQYVNLKNSSVFPDRAPWSWSSNNSLFWNENSSFNADSSVFENVFEKGEPGFLFLDNVQKFGRFGELKYDPANGGNPCMEQPLESFELCTLAEVYAPNCKTQKELNEASQFAFMYGKTVSLTNEQIRCEFSREAMTKNRRVGTSQTGIVEHLYKNLNKDLLKLKAQFNNAYYAVQSVDEALSHYFGVPRSVRTTTVKPSGTVSQLCGISSPGVHYPICNRYYIRRVILPDTSDLLKPLGEAGYHIEKSVMGDNSFVVEFPVDVGGDIPSENDVTTMEQIIVAMAVQSSWSDNAVSFTAKFDPRTESVQDIADYVEFAMTGLKGISFLPKGDLSDHYKQLPYENITKEEYTKRVKNLKPLEIGRVSNKDTLQDNFCDGVACEIKL